VRLHAEAESLLRPDVSDFNLKGVHPELVIAFLSNRARLTLSGSALLGVGELVTDRVSRPITRGVYSDPVGPTRTAKRFIFVRLDSSCTVAPRIVDDREGSGTGTSL
jgi:hypothetical protein